MAKIMKNRITRATIVASETRIEVTTRRLQMSQVAPIIDDESFPKYLGMHLSGPKIRRKFSHKFSLHRGPSFDMEN